MENTMTPTSANQDHLFVGAYASAPSLSGWNPNDEEKFLASVFALDGVGGLEVPITDKLHKYDEAWFLRQLPEHAQFVVTTIPGTMSRLEADKGFGLASTSESGRRAALDFVKEALEALKRLNHQMGKPSVVALELHAAPVAFGSAATAAALEASLIEISSWDTHGARLVLEHCDALMPDQAPAKGFLALELEARAVKKAVDATGNPMGMVINWGRSVIEQRRPEAAHEHIAFLQDCGLLGGVVFSGCADVDTKFGKAWGDVHVPPAPTAATETRASQGTNTDQNLLEPASLLTADHIKSCLQAAGTLPETGFRAVKVAAPPNADVDQRVKVITQALAAVRQAAKDISENAPAPANH
jgi:hypothetical protein